MLLSFSGKMGKPWCEHHSEKLSSLKRFVMLGQSIILWDPTGIFSKAVTTDCRPTNIAAIERLVAGMSQQEQDDLIVFGALSPAADSLHCLESSGPQLFTVGTPIEGFLVGTTVAEALKGNGGKFPDCFSIEFTLNLAPSLRGLNVSKVAIVKMSMRYFGKDKPEEVPIGRPKRAPKEPKEPGKEIVKKEKKVVIEKKTVVKKVPSEGEPKKRGRPKKVVEPTVVAATKQTKKRSKIEDEAEIEAILLASLLDDGDENAEVKLAVKRLKAAAGKNCCEHRARDELWRINMEQPFSKLCLRVGNMNSADYMQRLKETPFDGDFIKQVWETYSGL